MDSSSNENNNLSVDLVDLPDFDDGVVEGYTHRPAVADESAPMRKPSDPKTPAALANFLQRQVTSLEKELKEAARALAESRIAKRGTKGDAKVEATAVVEAARLAQEKVDERLKIARAELRKAEAASRKAEAAKLRKKTEQIINPDAKPHDWIALMSGERTWRDVEARWDKAQVDPVHYECKMRRAKTITRAEEWRAAKTIDELSDELFTARTREEWIEYVRAAAKACGPRWAIKKFRGETQVPDLDQIENMESILDFLAIETYYSEMRHEDVFVRDGKVLDLDPVIAEVRQCARTWGMGKGAAKETVVEQLRLLAAKDRRHEMRDWVLSAPAFVPDGSKDSPIERHFKTHVLAEGADVDLCREMHRIWCLQVGAALMNPRGQYRGVLVYVGGEYEGKSRALQSLALPGCVQTGQSFDPADEDSVHRALRHTIAEMSEVDSTFRKADGSRLKAFLGREEDQFHLRYDRGQTTWDRRTVFAASVNPDEQGKFLSATAGDTRWWVLPIKTFKPDPTLDMRAVWRQAMAEVDVRIKNGLPGWWPDRPLMERIVAANSAYRHRSPIEEAVAELYEHDASGRVSISEIRDAVKQHVGMSGWGDKDAKALKAAILKVARSGSSTVKGTVRWHVRQRGVLHLVKDGLDEVVDTVIGAFD